MASTSKSDDHLLYSRVDDTIAKCDKHCAPCYLGFLDPREQAYIQQYLSRGTEPNCTFIGGYAEAERQLLCVYPDFYDFEDIQPPLTAVAFRYRSGVSLSHRDFLGTLLSLGIRRDTIGDILCGNGLTVAFLRDEVAPFVCEQIDRVGGEGVTPILNYDGDLPLRKEYKEIQDTVASARLDAIVKALARLSREKAADMIRLGDVSVNHLPVCSVSAVITAPCTISARGIGRFYVDTIGPPTKKGRLILTARKCI